jgi:hypothetical protein
MQEKEKQKEKNSVGIQNKTDGVCLFFSSVFSSSYLCHMGPVLLVLM